MTSLRCHGFVCVVKGNMSSDSEMSEFSDMSGNSEDEDVEEGNDEDYDVIYSEITPYQDEPQDA